MRQWQWRTGSELTDCHPTLVAWVWTGDLRHLRLEEECLPYQGAPPAPAWSTCGATPSNKKHRTNITRDSTPPDPLKVKVGIIIIMIYQTIIEFYWIWRLDDQHQHSITIIIFATFPYSSLKQLVQSFQWEFLVWKMSSIKHRAPLWETVCICSRKLWNFWKVLRWENDSIKVWLCSDRVSYVIVDYPNYLLENFVKWAPNISWIYEITLSFPCHFRRSKLYPDKEPCSPPPSHHFSDKHTLHIIIRVIQYFIWKYFKLCSSATTGAIM